MTWATISTQVTRVTGRLAGPRRQRLERAVRKPWEHHWQRPSNCNDTNTPRWLTAHRLGEALAQLRVAWLGEGRNMPKPAENPKPAAMAAVIQR